MFEVPKHIKDERESIWIGYVSLERAKEDVRKLVHVYGNELVATPEEPWEALKIGGGTPPIRVSGGWLTYYHGVSGTISMDPAIGKDVRYAAGAMVLDPERPNTVLYRSKTPVLEPTEKLEQEGIVPNVVFPTAIDQREDGRVDVYYGMADSSIGVATTTLPDRSEYL
jgi:beta-1,2-mannobiose phosphorylase / 1,2-beta-oligomannan phosphorylase